MNLAPTSDWLSPMLVKELRQGVKSRSFMFAMLLLQGCVALVLCVRTILAGRTADLEGAEIAYWVAMAAPLLVIMPWTALMSVQVERRARTLELLHLTSLTPLRLVLGKWCSIMTRSLVLLSCVAPYFLVRYFIGGINVALEGVMLLVVVLLSALVTAICLYLSAFRHAAARWGLGLLLLVTVGLPTIVFFIFCQEEADDVLDAVNGPVALAVVTAFALTIGYFLLAAAGLIAPEVVSYEPAKRIASLLVMGVVTCFAHLVGEPQIGIVGVCIAGIASLDALCAEPRINRALARPFARLGPAGRLVGGLLYPGWPSAALFVPVAFATYALLCLISSGSAPHDFVRVSMHFALCGAGALLTSWAAIALFRREVAPIDGGGLLVLCAQVALGFGVLMGGRAMRDLFPPLLVGFLPGTAFFAAVDRHRDEAAAGVIVTLFLSLSVLIVRALPYWRRVGAAGREAPAAGAGPGGARP